MDVMVFFLMLERWKAVVSHASSCKSSFLISFHYIFCCGISFRKAFIVYDSFLNIFMLVYKKRFFELHTLVKFLNRRKTNEAFTRR